MYMDTFIDILWEECFLSREAAMYLWYFSDCPMDITKDQAIKLGKKWNENDCSYFYSKYEKFLRENGYKGIGCGDPEGMAEAFSKKGIAVHLGNRNMLWSEVVKQ